MRNKTILLLLTLFVLNTAFSQGSETAAKYRFAKKEIKGFMKLRKEQINKSAYNNGLSLCKKYNYSSDNDLTVGQSVDGDILFRFISSSNEETAVITDDKGKMIEVIVYLNEEYKPYNTISEAITEKEYEFLSNHGEYGVAVKYITRQETWFEVLAKRKGDSKSPTLTLFFSEKLKFLREEEKE